MSQLRSIATAVPELCVTASETKQFLAAYLSPSLGARFGRLVDSSQIRQRHSAMPLERLATLQTLEDRNRAYAEHAVPLAESAACRALAAADVAPDSVTSVICVSSTGYSMPSLDAHLINHLRLNKNCRRVALNQLGCGGGVAGLGLGNDLVRGAKSATSLVVTVELPSLGLQLAEPSVNDLLACTQFGDGAAAAVVATGNRDYPEIIATHTALLSDTVELDGILLTATGFRPIPRREFPRLIRNYVPAVLEDFLDAQGITRAEIGFSAVHGRSPQVMQAMRESLGMRDSELSAPRWVWEHYGNMLSSTVFFVLERTRHESQLIPGTNGLLVAFGAGVSCELTLLRAGGWLSHN